MSDYSITKEMRDGVEVFTLAGGTARAQIVPQWGANCFVFESQGQAILEPVAWEDFAKKPTSYGIPLLFPFPNRIRNQEFTFQGRAYRVDVAQHGFVRQRAWRVTDNGATDDAGAWLTCEFSAEDYAGEILTQFPFPFRAVLTYRLQGGRLTLDFTATNTGTSDMPAGFGIHPYFCWPEHSRIQIPAQRRWELTNSLPTGRRVELEADYDLRQLTDTGGLQLDDIYTDATPDADGLTRCHLTDEDAGTAIVVEFSASNLPHIVVYTAPAPRRALCIEPMSCPTDAFNLQARGIAADVIVLPPGDSANFQISLYRKNQADAIPD